MERYNGVSLEIGKFREDASIFEGAFSEPGYEPVENNLFELCKLALHVLHLETDWSMNKNFSLV